MRHQRINLLIAGQTALHPHRRAGIGRQIEHVPSAEQIFRPRAIQHHPRIDARSNGKRNPRGEIGLDKTRNHIGRRPLRGHNQVNPRGPRHLRQPAQRRLHISPKLHHQIGQLIHQHHNIGQRFHIGVFGDGLVVSG